MSKPKVLFVCLGNICRSPTAEAVFRSRATASGLEVFIDSAGTGAWHAGELPDARAREAGQRRGYSFAGQSARAVIDEDYEDFDFILVMDRKNQQNLLSRAPNHAREKIKLFLEYADNPAVLEVPDPYYGGIDGFETVLDLIESASDGLIHALTINTG